MVSWAVVAVVVAIVRAPEREEAPVTVSVPPIAVSPVKVEAPVTWRVEEAAIAPVKVEAPATAREEESVVAPVTARVDWRVEAPDTVMLAAVRVSWKVAGEEAMKTSSEPPPKVKELADN